jgi:hypothetical protein
MRSHAAHVSSINNSRHHRGSEDGGSSTFGDLHHGVVANFEREKGSTDSSRLGKGERGPITKTMSYSVSRDEGQGGV